jgi:hypothetical protein
MRHSVFTITTSILMDNPNIKIISIPFRTFLLDRWGVLMTIQLLRNLRVPQGRYVDDGPLRIHWSRGDLAPFALASNPLAEVEDEENLERFSRCFTG